jgi:hypothetical protein
MMLSTELARTVTSAVTYRVAILLQVGMAAKQCWIFSFDRTSLRCKECSVHGDRPFLRNKGDKTGGAEVVVLSDQSFPCILPVEGDKLFWRMPV